MDDVLDFTSGANHLGKPSAADLKLGLATGPVLFACRQVRATFLSVISEQVYIETVHLNLEYTDTHRALPRFLSFFQFPELHAMIMRRFSSKGDVDRAWQYALQVGTTIRCKENEKLQVKSIKMQRFKGVQIQVST